MPYVQFDNDEMLTRINEEIHIPDLVDQEKASSGHEAKFFNQ